MYAQGIIGSESIRLKLLVLQPALDIEQLPDQGIIRIELGLPWATAWGLAAL